MYLRLDLNNRHCFVMEVAWQAHVHISYSVVEVIWPGAISH